MINFSENKVPIIFGGLVILLIIFFHSWFSSYVGVEDWKRATPIPDQLENPYFWPPGVNYLGTPVPNDNFTDPFRKQVMEDYEKFMQMRKDVYREWRKQKFKPSNITLDN